MKKNDIYTADITDLNNLGMGVCRVDGAVVFVSGAVTGDIAEIKIIKVLSSYCVARTERIVKPSPWRMKEPFCAVSSSCGGCVYSETTYEKELELKREYVVHAMKKARADVKVENVLTAGAFSRYRNKAQYPVSCAKDGRLVSGFFARGTHRVIPSLDCPLEPEIFSSILAETLAFFDEKGVSAYDETSSSGLLRHVYVRQARSTREILLCIVINGEGFDGEKEFCSRITGAFPEIKSVYLNVNRDSTNVITGKKYRLVWGKEYITDVLCGNRIRISPASFYQVNRDGAELLYKKAIELLDTDETKNMLDLYCGIGTIGLSAARLSGVGRLIGVESVEEAVRDARANAADNGFENCEFICADASDIAGIFASRELSLDRVILDPPRKGCSAETLDFVAEARPEKIVYVSCSPDTLARDIVYLMNKGYSPGTVFPVDMFPRTGHVESVVKLTRAGL